MTTKREDVELLAGGFETRVFLGNTHNTTPTAAQILTVTADGAAAETATWRFAIINDESAEARVFLTATNGTDTFWTLMTKGI